MLHIDFPADSASETPHRHDPAFSQTRRKTMIPAQSLIRSVREVRWPARPYDGSGGGRSRRRSQAKLRDGVGGEVTSVGDEVPLRIITERHSSMARKTRRSCFSAPRDRVGLTS